MSTGTRLNWLAASIIALLLASAHLLDGPSDIEATQAVAADVHDAMQTAQAEGVKGTHIASTPADTQIAGAQ